MPKVAKELKDTAVRALRHHGGKGHALHPVGGVPGLILQVTAGEGRSWLMRVRVAGQRKHFGLGSFPAISLAEARRRAADIRDAVATGADPADAWRIGAIARDMLAKGFAQSEAWVNAREQVEAVKAGEVQARKLTFADAMEKYLASKLDEFKNEKHKKQWRSTLDNYAVPVIGKLPVDAVTVHDVKKILTPIWSTKTETATRLRGRIESVLAWATANEHRSGVNPARWKDNLKELLPKPSKVAKADNWPAISQSDVSAWFAALRKRDGMAARALEFLTLCASRSGEIRGATWDEIDLDAALWTIPAARMKMDREHRVPLTPEAVAILDALPRQEGSDYVFWAARGGQLSDMSISAVMRRMHADAVKAGGQGWIDRVSKRPAVPHGLRSTFRDWAAEQTD